MLIFYSNNLYQNERQLIFQLSFSPTNIKYSLMCISCRILLKENIKLKNFFYYSLNINANRRLGADRNTQVVLAFYHLDCCIYHYKYKGFKILYSNNQVLIKGDFMLTFLHSPYVIGNNQNCTFQYFKTIIIILAVIL